MKGQKTGGRAPGTPNADRAAFLETLARLKCDPVALAARIANGEHVFTVWDREANRLVPCPAEPALVCKMIGLLLDKAVASPKSVEVTGADGAPLVPPRVDFRTLPVVPIPAPTRATVSRIAGGNGKGRAPRVT